MRVFNKGGSTILNINGNTITNKGGGILLKINGNTITSKGGSILYRINGNTITNNGGGVILKFNGNNITSRNGGVLLKLNGNQILSKGGMPKYKMEERCNVIQITCILHAMKEINLSSKGKGGCFIATATMGSYNHPLVLELRDFRDNYLNNNYLGRMLIKFYYILSPYPAKIISKNNFLKKISYFIIIKPLSFIVKIIIHNKN